MSASLRGAILGAAVFLTAARLQADAIAPTVTITFPGVAQFTSGANVTIQWKATDDTTAADSLQINLSLSLDGGPFRLVANTQLTGLASAADGTGSFDKWFVPNRPSNNAVFRVEAVDAAGNKGTADSAAFKIVSAAGGAVPTTLRDFDMPGTQPLGIVLQINSPDNDCANCHDFGDAADSNIYRTWRGTMMGNASIDPLFEACLKIANQDAPESGDLCLRCHTPRAWLNGRSTPTDGSAVLCTDQDCEDKMGVSCDVCHRMVNPISQQGAPAIDAAILQALGPANTPAVFGNGMYVIDPDPDQTSRRRGPFNDITADPKTNHPFVYSPFHQESAICGTCHDVSNPVYSKQGDKYLPNAFDQPAPDFDPGQVMPIERTYSEWLNSAFAVSGPSCQGCHMKRVPGKADSEGVDRTNPPGLPMHDLTGGNVWIPLVLADMTTDGTKKTELQKTSQRAEATLKSAADLECSTTPDGKQLKVTVTNKTGHKLPTGYPEGRRMWVGVQFFDCRGNPAPIKEHGRYDPLGNLSTEDTKVYEADLVTDGVPGVADGLHFHFVLGNKVKKDNRIPPQGFTNAGYAAFGGQPVGAAYPDGQYWDETLFDIPPHTGRAEIRLWYQTASKEYISFLGLNNIQKIENGTPPTEMASTTCEFPNLGTGPALVSGASIKTHGPAGPFGIAIDPNPPPGQATVECRCCGPNLIELKFDQDVVPADGSLDLGQEIKLISSDVNASITASVAGSGSNTLTIHDLAGVPDGSCLTIEVNGLQGYCNSLEMAPLKLYLRALLGDVNNDGEVDAADVLQAKAVSAQPAHVNNFRAEVNLSGRNTSGDIAAVKAQSGKSAVACP